MSYLTRNILDFYKENEKNNWYLKKYFSNTNEIGYYDEYARHPIDSKWNKKDSEIATIDELNTYEINSFGCRGKIDSNATTVASGCSITFGIGVPESGRWTDLLSAKINKNIINLGSPGGSVKSICTNLIQYCMNNKMPNEIFCLFPDFFRSMVVADKEFYRSNKIRQVEAVSDKLNLFFCNPVTYLYDDSLFMEINDQKYIEDSTSPHQLILDAINYIYILESFCLTNNIKLYWTTWDINSNRVIELLANVKDFKLKNFTSFFPTNSTDPLGTYVLSNCNSEHGSEFKDSPCWQVGSDYSVKNYEKTKKYSHPGIHVQLHISDFFYNLYNKNSFSI